jgi:hypothetical protein
MESADALWFALAHLGVWAPRYWRLSCDDGGAHIVFVVTGGLGAAVGLKRAWLHRLPDDVRAAINDWAVAQKAEWAVAQKADQHRDHARDLCRKYLDWLGNPPHPKDTVGER